MNDSEKGEKGHKEVPWIEKFKGEESVSKGLAITEIYNKYYDEENTILMAGPINPNSQDSDVYNQELVYEAVGQRRAKRIFVANDDESQDLFVIVSHTGSNQFSPERSIKAGEIKEFYNVYEIRLRSPLLGHPYRVSEYYIRKCCPSQEITGSVSVSNTPLPVTNVGNRSMAWIHGSEITAPGVGTVLVTNTVSALKQGFIYGFLISVKEANDFRINWTFAGAAKSIRIIFGGQGTTEDSETDIALNEGMPADAGTAITITNVNAGGVGAIYQARLKYAEV